MYRNVFLVLLVIIPFACDNDDIEPICREDIVGRWVNIDNEIDTLDISFCGVQRTDIESPHGFVVFYAYKLMEDSIVLNYIGMTHFLAPVETCHICFLDAKYQYLRIDDFSQIYPCYPGIEFRRVDPE